MDIEKVADRILEERWDYVGDSFNGEFWEQEFYSDSLRNVIIRVLKEELEKGKNANDD